MWMFWKNKIIIALLKKCRHKIRVGSRGRGHRTMSPKYVTDAVNNQVTNMPPDKRFGYLTVLPLTPCT